MSLSSNRSSDLTNWSFEEKYNQKRPFEFIFLEQNIDLKKKEGEPGEGAGQGGREGQRLHVRYNSILSKLIEEVETCLRMDKTSLKNTLPLKNWKSLQHPPSFPSQVNISNTPHGCGKTLNKNPPIPLSYLACCALLGAGGGAGVGARPAHTRLRGEAVLVPATGGGILKGRDIQTVGSRKVRIEEIATLTAMTWISANLIGYCRNISILKTSLKTVF